MRSIPDSAPSTNRGTSEVEKINLDTAAARSECEIVSANWVECKVTQSKIHDKR